MDLPEFHMKHLLQQEIVIILREGFSSSCMMAES